MLTGSARYFYTRTRRLHHRKMVGTLNNDTLHTLYVSVFTSLQIAPDLCQCTQVPGASVGLVLQVTARVPLFWGAGRRGYPGSSRGVKESPENSVPEHDNFVQGREAEDGLSR